MRKSRFSETQIIAALRRQETGKKVRDICRDLGISEPTFYTWKSKYGGMSASEVKRVKDLEAENARLNDFNRHVLWIEVDTSLPAQRVIRVLERLEESRGLPAMIRVDNGPEFISHKLDAWCKERGVTLAFIQPGSPTQNAYIERLNGSLRRERLDAFPDAGRGATADRGVAARLQPPPSAQITGLPTAGRRPFLPPESLVMSRPENGEAYSAIQERLAERANRSVGNRSIATAHVYASPPAPIGTPDWRSPSAGSAAADSSAASASGTGSPAGTVVSETPPPSAASITTASPSATRPPRICSASRERAWRWRIWWRAWGYLSH